MNTIPQLYTLPNGVRIITEPMSGVRSASLGIWVATGSRHEKAAENGSAHFIEHMVFKGTQRRTAQQLAEEMDAIGGQINAYTAHETTCFYARCLDSHLSHALDILCDMVFCSRFDEADIQLERGVILEEIGMYEDNPEDLCAERLLSAVYKGTPLARPILGTKATLANITGAKLKAYMTRHYRPQDIVVSLAGSFAPFVVEELKARFASLAPQPEQLEKPGHYQPAFTFKKKATEQNQLVVAFPGLPSGHPRRFEFQLLSSILGGGMSSRLFQEVREKQGLCYSIYSYGASHAETGLFAIGTALGRETEGRALETIAQVVRDFTKDGPTVAELDRARELSKANVLMSLESTQARMNNLGRGTLLHGAPLTCDAVIAAYDAVTVDALQALATELLDFNQISLSALGRLAPKETYQAHLGL